MPTLTVQPKVDIRCHVTYHDAPHRRDWSYGIARLDNEKFTFTDQNGKVLVIIPVRDIKKIVTQQMKNYRKSFALVTEPHGTEKPRIFDFTLYRVNGEDGKQDIRKLRAWRSAFLQVGVKNDYKITLLVIVALIIFLIIFFIISNWNHNAHYSY